MKKLFALLTLSIIALTGCGDYPNELAVYDFDTAVVQYELTGQTTGDATLYMRGDQKALYKTVVVTDKAQNTLELDLGDKFYLVDMDKATATEVSNSEYETLKGLSKEEQNKYLAKKALGLKNSAEDPQAVTTKTVAGQKCDLYLVSNIGSACIWNGIVLEKEVNILDVTNQMVATSVKTNVEVQADKFEIPANVIVQ